MKERKILVLQLSVIFFINIAIISIVQLSAEAETVSFPYSNNSRTEISKSNDTGLLAKLISAEAGDEPYAGQVAVGAVVLNRVDSPLFPGSIAGVIYQPGAFSCLIDGQFDNPVSDSAYKAAEGALAGWDPSDGAIYYFNPATETSDWIRSRPVIYTIGNLKFCS